MTAYTEAKHALEAVLYEEPDMSREALTIPSGTAAFAAGMVLGATLASGAATATGFSTNTASVGAVGTITVGAAAKVGRYKLVIVEPGANVGTFVLWDPDGNVVGKGAVASAFSAGGLSFTIADAAADYAAGDGYHIDVTGTVKYVPYDDGNTDGSDVAKAIALYACDASGEEKTVAGLVRCGAVMSAMLSWHASADAASKAKAIADLAKSSLLVRA